MNVFGLEKAFLKLRRSPFGFSGTMRPLVEEKYLNWVFLVFQARVFQYYGHLFGYFWLRTPSYNIKQLRKLSRVALG